MLLSNRMAGAESVDEIEGASLLLVEGYTRPMRVTCSSEVPSAAIMVRVLKM
jgi:hypothetical protein